MKITNSFVHQYEREIAYMFEGDLREHRIDTAVCKTMDEWGLGPDDWWCLDHLSGLVMEHFAQAVRENYV